MHTTGENRQSVALGSDAAAFSTQDLSRHSFDLVLFPLYLQRRVAPRVRVAITPGLHPQADVVALYQAGGRTGYQCARLLADDTGVATDSDALYEAIHAAFSANAPEALAQYVGFTRYGTPPMAPLFAVALMYQRYGRGLYKAGDMRPTPWPALTATYQMRI